jgi:hypothetical protein
MGNIQAPTSLQVGIPPRAQNTDFGNENDRLGRHFENHSKEQLEEQ